MNLLITFLTASFVWAAPHSNLSSLHIGDELYWSIDTSTSVESTSAEPIFSFRVTSIDVRQKKNNLEYLILGVGTDGYLSEKPIPWYYGKMNVSAKNAQVQLTLVEANNLNGAEPCSRENFMKDTCALISSDVGALRLQSGDHVFSQSLTCRLDHKKCYGNGVEFLDLQ